MGVMSINEFNKNISHAIARAENGEEIVITRRGKEILCLSQNALIEAKARVVERDASLTRLRELMQQSLPFGGPATYDERTGSDRDEKWR